MAKRKLYFRKKLFHYKTLFKINILKMNISYRPGCEALWGWFGLSRASWLTIPRVLMHKMPDEWQAKMATLLEEYDNTFDFSEIDIDGTRVYASKGGKLTKIPDWLLNYRHPDNKKIESLMRSENG